EMLDRVGRDSEEKLSEYGIELIDIQVKRADLPEENEEAVYERMKSERDREAALLRAEGQEEAKEITSNADRESRVLVSEAEQEAAALRGEGEAQAMEIYSEAHSQDSEFYEFWKTLESYEESFKPGTSTLLLSPESRYMEFFEQGHNATAGESSSE
ncbi:MAG: SPFH domain-containing protein, partial [Candidatus Bipolaricaulota bacterium]